MGDQVWQVPRDQFVAVWNGASTLPEASARLKELVGVSAPGWALMARALELRKEGINMKVLVRPGAGLRVTAEGP